MLNPTWTPELHAEAVEMIDKLVRCPDLASIALVLTWHAWNKWPEQPLASHIWYSVMQARKGRDLPRIGATRKRDALRHCTQGAGMDEVMDPKPDALHQLLGREALELLDEVCRNDRERQLCEMFAEGKRNQDVAEALHVSQGRTTQMRQSIMERLNERLG